MFDILLIRKSGISERVAVQVVACWLQTFDNMHQVVKLGANFELKLATGYCCCSEGDVDA